MPSAGHVLAFDVPPQALVATDAQIVHLSFEQRWLRTTWHRAPPQDRKNTVTERARLHREKHGEHGKCHYRRAKPSK